MCKTTVNLLQESVKAVEYEPDSSSSDNEYLYSTSKEKSKIPTVNLKVNNVPIEMIVDT